MPDLQAALDRLQEQSDVGNPVSTCVDLRGVLSWV
jgi:hypothetical protein